MKQEEIASPVCGRDDVSILISSEICSNLLQGSPDLRIAGLRPFRPTPYSLGVRKGDKEWLDFINSTLTMVAQSGESEKLLDKWFGDEAKTLLRSLKK
jgi:ABC-type amino acid transport substrate-binding protein